MFNPFFKNCGPFKIHNLAQIIKLENIKNIPNIEIFDIKDLNNSKNSEITFYHSKKYKDAANKTKASLCITYENNFLENINAKNLMNDLKQINQKL